VTYRSLLDSMQFDDVIWRPYEEHKEIQGFEEIFWYSGWVMCGVVRVYRHFPERVRRQYGYVQNVPRHPTDVVELRPDQIVLTFLDFCIYTIKEPDWGEPAGRETWQMEDDCVLWYSRVSHPLILPLLSGDLLRPANEEQIIAQKCEQYEARSSLDTYDIVTSVVAYADEQLGQEAMSP